MPASGSSEAVDVAVVAAVAVVDVDATGMLFDTSTSMGVSFATGATDAAAVAATDS